MMCYLDNLYLNICEGVHIKVKKNSGCNDKYPCIEKENVGRRGLSHWYQYFILGIY
jgi:hypothetical protein